MKVHLAVICLLIASVTSGCMTLGDKTPPGPVCEVHNVPLKAGVAPVVYGLMGFDGEYLASKKALFPNSASFVIGGCSVQPEKAQAVAYCPKCRELDPVAHQKIESDGTLERSGKGPLVEIEVQFIAYAAAEVAGLSKSGMSEAAPLLAMYREGKGALVCAPKIVTQLGKESSVKAVEEVIYPTDFSVSVVTNVPGQAESRTVAVAPADFMTREVGVILTVMPRATADLGVLELNMTAEYVADPVWRTYTAEYTDPSGKEHRPELTTPFFYTHSIQPQVTVHEGQPTICGGGMLSRDKKTVTYVFVTARLTPVDKEPAQRKAAVDPVHAGDRNANAR